MECSMQTAADYTKVHQIAPGRGAAWCTNPPTDQADCWAANCTGTLVRVSICEVNTRTLPR